MVDNNRHYILVVADESFNQIFLQNILSKHNYQLKFALNLEKSLEIINSQPPILIIIDILKYKQNYDEFNLVLKSKILTNNISIIVISFLINIESKFIPFSVTGVDYLIKPYSEEDLVTKIETHLKIKKLKEELEHQDKLIQKVNKKISKIRIIDELTQLINRYGFETTLEQEWRRMAREKKYLSLIICDIDDWKLYKNTYGIEEGKKCLQTVAEIMKKSARRTSDLVARYGYKNFAIALPNTNPEGAIHVAELMRPLLNQLRSKNSKYFTLSMGISSTIPQWNQPNKTLIERANLALYEAKKQECDPKQTQIVRLVYQPI